MEATNDLLSITDGKGALRRPTSMGLYAFAGEHNGSPMYKLNEWILHRGKNGDWYVGNELDSTYKGVQLWNPSKTEGVPLNGWQYCWKITFYNDSSLYALGYCDGDDI